MVCFVNQMGLVLKDAAKIACRALGKPWFSGKNGQSI
jgi:hypothetical protein